MGRLTTKGPLQELRKMAADEGLTGFWKGAGPEMTRAAVFTASQLATYDETKRVHSCFCPIYFHSHALMLPNILPPSLYIAARDEMDFAPRWILSASHVIRCNLEVFCFQLYIVSANTSIVSS